MIARKKLPLKFCYGPDLCREGEFFTYNPKTGSAGDETFSCREGFEYYLNNNTHWVGFIYDNLDIKKLNSFFVKIENQLKIKEKTTFYHASCQENDKGYDHSDYSTIINVSPFWMTDTVKRGFFTLFLRCGAVFYKNNIEEAINEYDLASDVKTHIFWFLSGNTEFKGKSIGYGTLVNALSHMDSFELSTSFIKPGADKLKGYAKYMGSMDILKLRKNS